MSREITLHPGDISHRYDPEIGCYQVKVSVPFSDRFSLFALEDLVRDSKKRNSEMTAVFGLKKKPRSLDANAYAWVLIGKLASKIGVPRDSIYRQLLRQLGTNYEHMYIASAACDDFDRHWSSKGLGWFTEYTGTILSTGEDTLCGVFAYYGSSVFDTEQMSRFIDLIVQECREQEIETMTPQQLDALKERWMP